MSRLTLVIKTPSTIYFTAAEKGAVKYFINGTHYGDNLYEKGIFKYNFPVPGIYIAVTSSPVIESKTSPLEIVHKNITLPPPDRNKAVGIKKAYFDTKSNSPARIYTDKQIVVLNPKFRDYSIQIRYYILLHEMGHYFYSDEADADTFAAYHYLKDGYNPSEAFDALASVLHPSKRNDERIKNIYNLISKH